MGDHSLDYTMETFIRDVALLDFVLDEKQQKQFFLYADLLRMWNERMNLTSITDLPSIFVKHFLDSMYMAKLVFHERKDSRILDMGTGAGFPGVVIGIMFPQYRVTLCDSLQKRTVFLREVQNILGLDQLEIVHGRAEELAKDAAYRSNFQVVTARAVAKLSTLVEWCLPFLTVGGTFAAMKGPDPHEEIAQADLSMRILGGKLQSVVSYDLPLDAGTHTIVQVKKVKPTSRMYPRKPGEALRHPL